ncbi:MAG: polyprenyl synthetase family protein [Succinivibrio sp.]|nr:polyprenyl synthetase family protein [Succinivibrio sp.]
MFSFDKLTESDIKRVNEILYSTLEGNTIEKHVNDMCMHVIAAGGKRIRPKLAVLTAHLLSSFSNSEEDREHLAKCAAAVEYLHTASLIHDDVIDKATLRRGKPTLNETDGNHAAVLAGDYMFTRCFVTLHGLESVELLGIVNETLSALIAGELNQLKKVGDQNITVADYRQTVFSKTGALFVLATKAFAVIKKESPEVIRALSVFGEELGIGFQVMDDILDYSSSSADMGKPTGEDLEDQRITLPLIFALKDTSGEHKEQLSQAISDNNLEQVNKFLQKTEALEKCRLYAQEAVRKAKKALEIFPDSEYRQALYDLADAAISRDR